MSDFNIKWLVNNINHNATIFYIGTANLDGVIEFRNNFPNAIIHAFEPSNFWVDCHPNIELAKKHKIEYHKTAVSDVDGVVPFYFSEKLNTELWPYSSSIFKPNECLDFLTFAAPTEVPSVTLESFCSENNIWPDFIHVDAQGAEYVIFSKIGKYKPKMIWTEICEFSNYATGTTYEDFYQLMIKLGYKKLFKQGADELYVLKEVNITDYTPKTNNIINSLRKNKINFVFKKDGNHEELHSENAATFYQHMTKLKMVNKVYDTDNLPNDVFVYEYRQPWTIEPANFFGSNDTGFLELDPCPDNVRKRIHEKTAFLVLTIPHESPLQPHRLQAMHQYFKKHGLPPSQVIYLTCCLNATELYKEYCDSIGESPLCIMDYSIEYLTTHSTLAIALKDSRYDTRLRNKTFLMFNRRWKNHPHRSLFLYNIFKMNLLDSFYMSFNKTDVDDVDLTYSETIREYYPKVFHRHGVPLDLDCLDKLESCLPLYLDTNDLVTSNLMYENFDLTKKLYDNSFINIVSETYFYTSTSNIVHITEKTFKPILYSQPFIILGPPTILKKLREMGFKTFDTVWDESYDETLNHTERFYKILELCEKINRWPAIKKVMAMKQCKSIVEHNFNLLLKFNDEKKLVLDFIKRHKLSSF